jgi:hypothetical protein
LTLVMFEAKVFELHLMTLEMLLVSLFGIINLFFISFHAVSSVVSLAMTKD